MARSSAAGGVHAERGHLDRQRVAAERVHPFAAVGDHDHAGGGGGDDLLAQQRAAAALDQAQIRADLVGAVHGQVEPGVSSRVVSGMPQRVACGFGFPRGRHRHDVEAAAHAFAEQVDEMARGRSGAEAEPHAGPHESTARAAAARFWASAVMVIGWVRR